MIAGSSALLICLIDKVSFWFVFAYFLIRDLFTLDVLLNGRIVRPDQVRHQVGEGAQDESPLPHPLMGQDEGSCFESLVAVEQDIYIDWARSPPFARLAAQFGFDAFGVAQ